MLQQAPIAAALLSLEDGVTSALTEVECRRTLDNERMRRAEEPEIRALRFADLHRILARMRAVELSASILRRAGEPFHAPLGTLDAIHLATALAWEGENEAPLAMMTHDAALARAARAYGMEVLGG